MTLVELVNQHFARSRSQSFVPLDQRSENESSGSKLWEHPFLRTALGTRLHFARNTLYQVLKR